MRTSRLAWRSHRCRSKSPPGMKASSTTRPAEANRAKRPSGEKATAEMPARKFRRRWSCCPVRASHCRREVSTAGPPTASPPLPDSANRPSAEKATWRIVEVCPRKGGCGSFGGGGGGGDGGGGGGGFSPCSGGFLVPPSGGFASGLPLFSGWGGGLRSGSSFFVLGVSLSSGGGR